MNSTFKILGFGGSVLLGALLVGCGSGSDNNGSGGAGGAGGGSNNGGASGATAAVTTLFGFDTDTEAFMLNTAAGTVPYTNLVNPAPTTGDPPSLGWAGTKDYGNDANSGALMITATYTFWNQSVSAEVVAPTDKTGAPMNFKGKTLKAQVFLQKGLSPDTATDAPGGVVFYVKSGTNYDWGQAAWTNLTTYGSWVTVKFNLDNPDPGSAAAFDPTDPVQMGFQLSSGGGGSHCPDAQAGDPNNATFTGQPTATCPAWAAPLDTVVYIDKITIQSN